MFQRILFLCTGNICRSPTAEALLLAYLPALEVTSAGSFAMVGYGADPETVAVAHDRGLDLRAHRARQASPELLAAQDLILTLDQSHSDWVTRQFPTLRGRVHKLMRWRGGVDVIDPYGGPPEVFVDVFEHIELGIQDWLPRLRPRAGSLAKK